MVNCPVCKSPSSSYYSTKVLGKYSVKYFRCSSCKFIFTEKPYWLEEAYTSAITQLDIGLIQRNESIVPVVRAVINKWFNSNDRFIDYGGGYGMLVRMMRDRGFDFYRQDVFCPNLYANSFDVTDVPPFKAEIVTAFEVFEHLPDPVAEMEKMLDLSDNILFSTTVQPADNISLESWWYVAPETGQHVSLYSRTSLYALAKRFDLNYCWNDQNIHLFSRSKISDRLFKIITNPRLCKWYNALLPQIPSLLGKDYEHIHSQLGDSLRASNLSNT